MNPPIFLDHHATTPLDPRVLEAMMPYLTTEFGNASSTTHAYGWRARDAVEKARQQVADLIGAHLSEIIFTSSATESNRLALAGYDVRASPLEHSSVFDLVMPAEAGIQIFSTMLAHNEIGTIYPVREIAEQAHSRGALMHSDITQAVGRIPVDVKDLDVDLASFSAHKIYGPKGAGALFCRRGVRTYSETGTLNVPAIVGFGAAAQIAKHELLREMIRIAALRDRLQESLLRAAPDAIVNGSQTNRLPGNLNISFPDIDGERLMLNIQNYIAVSQGSACLSKKHLQSPTLKALGLSPELAQATLRIGVGRFNTAAEIDRCQEVVCAALNTYN